MSSERWDEVQQEPVLRRARLEQMFVVALFVLGFGVRWLFADGDFHGDEAWYFYLSRTFGVEPGVQVENPWFHIANRPLFYAFYHLSTYGGLISFRLLGCAVGALLPVLAFVAARRFGASFLSAAGSACCLCIQAQQLRYSAAVFPDTLAAALGLGACWAVAARVPRAASALAICCVAAKESFIAVPVMIALLDILTLREGVRFRLWHCLAIGIPTAYVGMLTTIALSSSTLRFQGWSDTALTLRTARNMWVGWELWPLLAWLAYRRQARCLVMWLGLPLFYLAWNRVLGRGLAPWYVVGPAAFAAVAAPLAIDEVYARCVDWATKARLKPSAAGVVWMPRAAVGLCLLCLAPIPLYGALRVRAQWRTLAGRFPQPDAASKVRAVIAQRQPSDVFVVDCFWAYRYSHLRGREPASPAWWYNDTFTHEILTKAKTAALTVTCRSPGHEPIVRLLSDSAFEVLYEDPDYLVSAARPANGGS